MPETAFSCSQTQLPSKSCFRRGLGLLWRLAVLLLAFWLLKITLDSSGADVLADLRGAHKPFLLAAFLAYGLIQLLAAWRWRLLMEVQKMPLPFFQAVKLTMIGNFFSLVIPGAVSGDLLKVAYAGQCFKGRKTEILLTIMLDRILGLFAMFFAATLATLLCLGEIAELWRQQRLLGIAVLLANAGCLACIIAYAIYRSKNFFLKNSFLRGGISAVYRHLPKMLANILERMQAAFALYQTKQRILGKHVLYSILIHLINAFCLFAIGRSLSEKAISALQYTLSMQIANATGLLPLTPGGLGMRDAVSAAFFNAFEANPPEVAGSIPVVFSIIVVSWSLIGAVVFICSPAMRKFTPKKG
jgi:uncharacterized protein (TIRG00374 family)